MRGLNSRATSAPLGRCSVAESAWNSRVSYELSCAGVLQHRTFYGAQNRRVREDVKLGIHKRTEKLFWRPRYFDARTFPLLFFGSCQHDRVLINVIKKYMHVLCTLMFKIFLLLQFFFCWSFLIDGKSAICAGTILKYVVNDVMVIKIKINKTT